MLEKPITSELGGVSPTIVLPGKWSSADLRFQAEHVVTQKLHNGGFNCVASQVLVLSSDWEQKDAFLDAIRAVLRSAPARAHYYPGCEARIDRARADYPRPRSSAARLLITGLDLPPATSRRCARSTSRRCSRSRSCRDSASAFLHAAVEAVNERLRGHARREPHRPSRDAVRARAGAGRRRRRAALRHGRDQCVDRRRLSHAARELGRVRRPHPGGHPERHRCRPQRPPAREPRAHSGARAVPARAAIGRSTANSP